MKTLIKIRKHEANALLKVAHVICKSAIGFSDVDIIANGYNFQISASDIIGLKDACLTIHEQLKNIDNEDID